MRAKIKSCFSVFFIAVFLFPTIVKEIHSVNHEKVFQCDAKGEMHLHTQHHDCTLCDFVLPVVFAPSKVEHNLTATNFAEYVFPHQTEIYFPVSQFSSALLRAPPAIS